jgi:GntR family transcriptional repressor for pyruvate dehydrogenase complex
MPAASVHHRSLDQLYSYILSQGLGPGDPLPPLTEMADRFGVSVASLREAVRTLEASGVVAIHHGVGTFLQAYDYGPMLQSLSFSALFDPEMACHLLQTRAALEIGALSGIIDLLTLEDLEALDDCVARMSSPEGAQAAEFRFHMLLVARLANPFMAGLLRLCWLSVGRLTEDSQAATLPHDAIHRELAKALRDRDRAGSVASMQRYLNQLGHELASAVS